MAFCGGRLRVVLLTWHLPLREVPRHLTAAEFSRSVKAADELAKVLDRPSSPSRRETRIAVCGLNPHAGEGGLLGSEEKELIDPLLDAIRPEFPGLSRALPADTVFARQLRGEFDVVLALYHDQGLAPLKAVEFDEAVNVTLGLPFVRTSPDHGTAFGIAGLGRADPRSFTRAVAVARLLLESR
jgi:4-hydroxythreonine-4-phosphate dehydrogenase